MIPATSVWASTAAVGMSSRGNHTFLISSALEINEALPSCKEAWKKPQTARPVSTNSG